MGKKLERLQRMLVIINKLKGLQRYVPREELENYLGIHNVKNVRVLIRYDIENSAFASVLTRNETDIISMKRMARKKNNMKGSFSTLIY